MGNKSPTGETEKVTEQLRELYAERRKARAEQVHGNPVEIIRRARIESELERLMTE